MIAFQFLCHDQAGLTLTAELEWMGTSKQWELAEEYLNWYTQFGSYKWQEK